MLALNGEWKLVYTSNSELTALLALGKLPFVQVGDITQTIDGPSLSVINKVTSPTPRRPLLSLQPPLNSSSSTYLPTAENLRRNGAFQAFSDPIP